MNVLIHAQLLQRYEQKHDQAPRPDTGGEQFRAFARAELDRCGVDAATFGADDVDRALRTAGAELSHVCAIVGGVVGQEVLKVLHAKDPPVHNVFLFDGRTGNGFQFLIPQVPANLLLVKNVAVSGLFFGAHLQHDPNAVRASAEQLVRWWLLGEIKPHVGARLPLAQVNEAFALIEGRGTTGKVVLEP